MLSKAETARRAVRHHLVEERAATVLMEVRGINRHYALQVATADRLWGDDEAWREYVANSNVSPCQLSCCNPTD